MNDTHIKTIEGDSGQPLYIQLAQSLGDRIASGDYAIGDLLPTEAEIGASFGVSRYTVRQAIQHLRQQGLVSARKGVGTRVEARQADPRYSQSLHSLSELLQFAHETRFDLVAHESILARGALAESLGCRAGKPWVHVVGVRYGDGGDLPICLTELHIDAAYKELATDAVSLKTAFWALIEEHYGETVIEVEQQIEAAVLTADQAAKLKSGVGMPALKFTRRYFVTGRRLVEMSVSLHPADRFTYQMTIKRETAPG